MPKTNEPISPEEFLRILNGLEILSVDVDEYSGKVLSRDHLDGRDSVNVLVKDKQSYKVAKNRHVHVWHTYELTITDGAPEEKAKLMTMMVRFRITYASNETFTDEFFEQFKVASLRFQTGPYARAWVHDHCLRMGVPPLIMPLFRVE